MVPVRMVSVMSVEAMVLNLLDEVKLMRDQLNDLVGRQTIKDFYSTEEFAALKGMKPKTVRDYCNEGRLNGEKQRTGHGRSKQWVISHAELLRYEREGLLNPRKQPAH